MPTASSRPARFVVQTARIRIIRMSTSGVRERSSTATQPASTARPAATRPSVRTDSQPHDGACVIASRTPVSPADSSSAAPS